MKEFNMDIKNILNMEIELTKKLKKFEGI